jgi:ethanolamine utilization cobalamin adenosyltransferase
MALVTEAVLRHQFGGPAGPVPARYEVPAGTVVTPSARSWLVEHHIDLVIDGAVVFACPQAGGRPGEMAQSYLQRAGSVPESGFGTPGGNNVPKSAATPGPEPPALPAFVPPDHFDVIDGSQVTTKPEHLTALRGNLLVPKNHPEIRFRGRVDSLEADVLAIQVAFTRLGLTGGVADLDDVLAYLKQVMRAEVLDEPFAPVPLLGLDEGQLRERSHYPQRYYGIPHFAAGVDDGAAVVLLNRLRTRVREVELAAYDAYAAPGTTEPRRVDIIRALNRLSSAVYLMMFKAKTKEYE